MMIIYFSQILFFIALLGIFSVAVGYPFAVLIGAFFAGKRKQPASSPSFSVSLIVVVHNGVDFVSAKYENSMALEYPKEQLEVVFYSDGSDDGTAERLKALNHSAVRVLINEHHEGKYMGLNQAAEVASGEILIFSDVDAMLAPDAILRLVRHFSDHRVGGVCGRRGVRERHKPLSSAQQFYVTLDSTLKQQESRMGNITANDGKLYALRKSLFSVIPPGVTDDLYAALNVIHQRKNFLFEPEAVAHVPLPSRNAHHEIERRRRIVSQSLNSIFSVSGILDPRKYGFYSIRLLINKVFRRCLPLFLLVLFFTSLVLSQQGLFYALLLGLQIIFYLMAAVFPLVKGKKSGRLPPQLIKIISTAFYICTGMYGTLLGLIDLIFKTPPAKWTPKKKDV